MSDCLITPHGGALVDLLADPERAAEFRAASRDMPSWDMTPRHLCDLELLLNGGFSPLRGFMTRGDYESVCSSMRLLDGTLWPIPITLDVPEDLARNLDAGRGLALRDPEGVLLAVLWVEEVWKPDLTLEAQTVFGTVDEDHPGVSHLLQSTHSWYVGGRIEGIHLPIHYDFRSLRLTPRQVRADLSQRSWERVVAFQTRNPMHRAHYELTLRAARDTGARLLVNPVVGLTKPGDVDHYSRVRCYQAVLRRYPPETAMLTLLPLAMRLAGPREALWHGIIRKNYGCTHFIVGRDHAGPGADSRGTPFYDPYEAQAMFLSHQDELGIGMVPFREMAYVPELDSYLPEDEVGDGKRTLSISGTEFRRRLVGGEQIPEWFSFPEVVQELRRTYPPRDRQGLTIFFTGLSGSGKSTIANVLLARFLEMGDRPITLLDGDVVRKHLSSELGFSREHRDINIRRIGFVASEITKNGGIAICAPIAPYDATRKRVRAMIDHSGGFLLVHVSTPLDVCEQRDRKGLYAKARAGLIEAFTGISDPYEVPEDAEIVIDTTITYPEEAADEIVRCLQREGYVPAEDPTGPTDSSGDTMSRSRREARRPATRRH